jgi:hypothetical protein
MVLPEEYKFLQYDDKLMMKGQLVAHFYNYENGSSGIEIGKIHCKPTKTGNRWIKYPDLTRPYSADLAIKDYLDLWCFAGGKDTEPTISSDSQDA